MKTYYRRNILPSLIQECKIIASSVGEALEWLKIAHQTGPSKAFDSHFINEIYSKQMDGAGFEGCVMPAQWADKIPGFLRHSRGCLSDPAVTADCRRFKAPQDEQTQFGRGEDKLIQYSSFSVPCVPFPLLALGWFDHDTTINLPHYCDGERLPLSSLHEMSHEHEYDRQGEDSINCFVVELIISSIDRSGQYIPRKIELINAMRKDGMTDKTREMAQSLADYVNILTAEAQLTEDFILKVSPKALPGPVEKMSEPAEELTHMLEAFSGNATTALSPTILNIMNRYFLTLISNSIALINPIFARVTHLSEVAESAGHLIKWLDDTHQLDVPDDSDQTSYTPEVRHLGIDLPKEFHSPNFWDHGYPYQEKRDGILDPLGFNDDANRIKPWAPNIGDTSPTSIQELNEFFLPMGMAKGMKNYTDSDRAYAMLRYIQNQVTLFHRPQLEAAARQPAKEQTLAIGL